jgi:hypothetical protein
VTSVRASCAAGGFTYDLFNPAARAYAWGNMQAGYVEQCGPRRSTPLDPGA